MDFLPRYPHLSILSFSPSLPVNGDGLRHLEEVEEVEEEMGLLGGRVVKFSKSVALYTQLCLKQEKKPSESCSETRCCSDLFVISIADDVHFLTNEHMGEIKLGHVAIQGLWAY